jgi:hypothetical protein
MPVRVSDTAVASIAMALPLHTLSCWSTLRMSGVETVRSSRAMLASASFASAMACGGTAFGSQSAATMVTTWGKCLERTAASFASVMTRVAERSSRAR